jgi:hypothetical protein
VVPVQLGCCPPGAERCLLCGPPPPEPLADTLQALVEHYARERLPEGAELRVGFYGGAPPSDLLLSAARDTGLGPLPFTARVRPDLLTRAEARRLADRGAVAIELDALTFDDAALRAVGRRYGRRMLIEQLEGIRALGLSAGIVLAPGLPHTSFDTALADARTAAPLVSTARLHPVLVLEGSRLREAHMDGTYVPLTLGEAVTICRGMMDLLEDAGVAVIRVGVNPAADGLGRAVAGPRHPALRQLADARKVLEALHRRLEGTTRGASVAIRCHPADETCTRGPRNQHVRTLRAAFGLAEVRVRPDPTLARGELRVEEAP